MFNQYQTKPKQRVLDRAQPWIQKLLQCDYEVYTELSETRIFNFIINNEKANSLGIPGNIPVVKEALDALFREYPEYDILVSKTGRMPKNTDKFCETLSFEGRTMRGILNEKYKNLSDVEGPAKVRDALIEIFSKIYPEPNPSAAYAEIKSHP